MARQLLRHPAALAELPRILLLLLRPDLVAGALVRMSTRWRQVLLPAYRSAVEQAEAAAGEASPAALVGLVEAWCAVSPARLTRRARRCRGCDACTSRAAHSGKAVVGVAP